MPNIIWEALFDSRVKSLLPFVRFVAGGGSESKNLVTIEVVGSYIVQARGACNRRLESKEYKVINQWASKQNLGMKVI